MRTSTSWGQRALGQTLLVSALICAAWPAAAAHLSVETIVEPGSKGVVKVALWKGESAFLKAKPYRSASVELSDGKATAIFDDVEPGEYAVSTFYDKNSNGKMDQNFVGKPTEPTGFSNDARQTFGPAKYKDARFELGEQGRTITIHLK